MAEKNALPDASEPSKRNFFVEDQCVAVT